MAGEMYADVAGQPRDAGTLGDWFDENVRFGIDVTSCVQGCLGLVFKPWIQGYGLVERAINLWQSDIGRRVGTAYEAGVREGQDNPSETSEDMSAVGMTEREKEKKLMKGCGKWLVGYINWVLTGYTNGDPWRA